MKSLPKVLAGIAAVVILVVVGLVANQSGAGAWPPPDFETSTAACVGGTRSTDATLTAINRETGFPGSPGHPKVMSVYPSFEYTEFDPAVLPNDGHSSATMTIKVPANQSGVVVVMWEFNFYGTSGSHSFPDLRAEIPFSKCIEPTTTTTSTTSTSTTSTSTTSTTQPTTSTTSTTVPSTTSTSTTSTTRPTTSTTSTTQPTTSTTSTTMPTTSTTSTTQPSTTSTSTTQPSTTTTVPCEENPDPDSPQACLIPPVTIERPATPVPATPRFTG